jgi:hypothetical protein
MSEKMNITLTTPEGTQASLHKNDLLFLNIALHHHGTLEAVNHNDSVNMDISILEEKLSREEIGQNEYDDELEKIKSSLIHIDYISIGSDELPWYTMISFIDDAGKRLGWDLSVTHAYPQEPVIKLDSKIYPNISLVLTPEKVKEIPKGTYNVIARLNESSSNVVVINVNHEEEFEPNEAKIERKVTYFLGIGAIQESLNLIEKVLEKDPHSVKGHYLKGKYFEAINHRDSALSSYLLAKDEFEKSNPNIYEPPIFIEKKISELTLRKTME